MAILSGGDAVFHELEVALGRRRQGDLGPGRYVEPQRSSVPEPEPQPEPAEVRQLPVPDQAGWQTRDKAAQFSVLVRSKLQALVTPPAKQRAYPASRPQLPPPGADFHVRSDGSELEQLLLVRYSRCQSAPSSVVQRRSGAARLPLLSAMLRLLSLHRPPLCSCCCGR